MTEHDSSGFITDESGIFWGKYGAAGVLLRCPQKDGTPAVLMQHRAQTGHFGGTWGFPGGARDSHETIRQAALRELYEETGIPNNSVHIIAEKRTFESASGWTYTTIIGLTTSAITPIIDAESEAIQWIPEPEVASLNLHPALQQSWQQLAITTYHHSQPNGPQLQAGPQGWEWYITPA